MQTQPTTQFMVRMSPKRPADAPSRVGFPWLEGIGRRFYDADQGFVTVPRVVADLLRRVHVNCELTERGGTGPLLFDVLTPEQAQRIVQIEERRALIEASGAQGNAALRAALAGTVGADWTDEDLANLGVSRQGSPISAADIAKQAAAQATGDVGVGPTAGKDPTAESPTAESPKWRVGRRPPKGKAPLPGAPA